MKKKEKLLLQTQSGALIIRAKDLIYCIGDGNYTILHLNGGKVHVAKLLNDLELSLKNSDCVFFRVHRSYLVNLDHIKEYKNHHIRKLILSNNVEIPISTRKTKEFYSMMKETYLHLD
jgi:two-component system, LytTR family, response regulator